MNNPEYKINIPKLSDTIDIPVKDDLSGLVALDSDIFRIEYKKLDMIPLLGDSMCVRSTVAQKLMNVQRDIQSEYPKFKLSIAYGYRAPEVQKKYFNKRLEELNQNQPGMDKGEKIELAHAMSAHPDSAGHTTGGAIDITIWDSSKNKGIDMGSDIAQFGDVAYTLYPNISSEQKLNRLYLQKTMLKEGFAPFFGEWWHFSYGDKEWAFYYKKPNAIYKTLSLSEAKELLLK